MLAYIPTAKIVTGRSLFPLPNPLAQGEVEYIRSLSACMYWMARGGKSGSTFCKTKDDRFILKVKVVGPCECLLLTCAVAVVFGAWF